MFINIRHVPHHDMEVRLASLASLEEHHDWRLLYLWESHESPEYHDQ